MLAIILLWIVVYLSGMLLCKIERKKETSQLWIHLTGFFFLFLSQGFLFFGGQLLGISFSTCKSYLELWYAAVSFLSLIVCRKEILSHSKRIKSFSVKKIPYFRHISLIVFLLIGLLWMIYEAGEGNRNDAVVEIAGTTLLTDTMNQYHPFTHEPLRLGVILTRKIITLPFWYAALSSWIGCSPFFAVTVVGTSITLIFALLAFAELGSLLFERNRHYTCWLVIFLELLYLSGNYYEGSEAFRQLYYGYSGEVIVATVLVPAMLITLYRMMGATLRSGFKKEKYGLGIGAAGIRIMVLFALSIFLTTIEWGLLMLMITILLFVLMLGIISGMKRIQLKWEEEGWKKS